MIIKKIILSTLLMVIGALTQIDVARAQDPGDRAEKFRGTWWSGLDPDVLDEKILSLRTLDGFGVGFTAGATQSAAHTAPSRFRSLPGGDAVFPPDDDTYVLDSMKKITEAGFMVQAYTNSENFVGDNGDEFVEFAESWKNWCDTDPEAVAFVNSQSYHTKAGFPDRKYMFCYAEFILKEHSLEYGQYISLWQFDSAKEMESQGDDATSGNVDDQRIYEAYANAARAGNDDIAVSFNNGRSTSNYPSYPFAVPTRFDDFTFGHAFGGNNNHAEKVNGNQFNLNYQNITRMTETDGYVHEGGNWDWDDKIVGNFTSKLSTSAWSYGPNQAWEQDDFNEWNAEALSAGGMMSWSGSFNRSKTFYYDWVYDMLKATDDYLFERGISINGENPIVEEPETESSFTPDPNKTYYIDNPKNNLRLAAAGNSEDPSTVATDETTENTQWKFVSNGNGEWYIDRAAGGSLPRLRTDKTELADMDATSSDGTWESFSFTEGSTNNTHFITSENGPDGFNRLQISPNGSVNMVPTSYQGTWESFTITEAGSISGTSSSIVHITKRNAPDFAIDGGRGRENEQNVYLYGENESNVNQQWIEIDRGQGYYSYQKQGTEYCLDGGRGGANRQNVYLWSCGENNANQHWHKEAVDGGAFKLIKRNAAGFALDGGSNGANNQNVQLYDATATSQNLHWFITPIGSASVAFQAYAEETDLITFFPNPVLTEVSVRGAADDLLRIYDLGGRLLLTKQISSDNETIDLNGLSPGLYFARVNGAEKSTMFKIVKE